MNRNAEHPLGQPLWAQGVCQPSGGLATAAYSALALNEKQAIQFAYFAWFAVSSSS
jgi:hypothetical protein